MALRYASASSLKIIFQLFRQDEEFACEPPTRWLPPNRVMHAQLLKKAKEDGKKKKEHSEL
jgi:hypothetical protein